MEDYKKKYEEAMLRMNKWVEGSEIIDPKEVAEFVFPELKESGDEMVRKHLLKHFRAKTKEEWNGMPVKNIIAWLEKQGNKVIDCSQNHQDSNHPNGCIVLEDFNGGEGFYKLNLDYLNKKQLEEVEEMVRTWNKESEISDDNIKNCIGMCLTDVNEQRFKDYNTNLKDCLAWLEKQDSKKHEEELEKAYKTADEVQYRKGFEDAKREFEKQDEQKSAWSEEDEKMLKHTIDTVKLHLNHVGSDKKEILLVKEEIDWLKSLKERMKEE